MIKVTHILRSLEFGGAEKLVVDLAGCQRESGWIEPSIVCMKSLGPLEEPARNAGLACEVVGLTGVRYLSPMLKVRRMLSGNRPDIVHTHNLVAQVHGAPAARSLRIPVIHTKHGRDMSAFGRFPALRGIVYGLSRMTAVVSEETKANFLGKTGLDPGRVTVIYNGIDVGRYGRAGRDEMRSSLGIGPDQVVFGSVSRLSPVKDHPTMLRAFAEVAAREARSVFLIVGDGAERGRIERLIGELSIERRVILAGYTDRVEGYLAAMDMFLQPSTEEGLSLTILEAAASGVPVVATSVGGTPEIITDGETGTLVDVGDAEELAGIMRRFIADRREFIDMAAGAGRVIEEKFSQRSMVSSYESLYSSVLGGRHDGDCSG